MPSNTEQTRNIISNNNSVRENLLAQGRGMLPSSQSKNDIPKAKQPRMEKEAVVDREKLVSRNRYKSGVTYLDYFRHSYGKDDSVTSFLTQILSGIYPEYSLRETRVGVVDSPRPINAVNGIVTTNPNYTTYGKIADVAKNIWNGDFDVMKDLGDLGTDTRLGVVTNALYSRALLYGAKVNTARGRYSTEEGGHPYITPKLYEEYGNNSATIARLSDILWIDSATGRTRDDLGADVKIMSYDDAINSDELGYKNHIEDQFIDAFNDFKQKYTPESSNQYYTFVNRGESISSTIEDNQGDGIRFRTNYSVGINNDLGAVRTVKHHVYDEGDEIHVSKVEASAQDEEYGLEAGFESSPKSENTKDDVSNNTTTVSSPKDEVYAFDEFISLNESEGLGNNNLLATTNDLFNNHKISTMVARFHSKASNMPEPSNDAAYDPKFGNSHGRSLKKLNANSKNFKTNGYSNPYCRVWTYHHQYFQYKKTIRPFNYLDETGKERNFSLRAVQDNVLPQRAIIDDGVETGPEYLDGYSVLGSNGFVKIGPYDEDYHRTFGLQGKDGEATDTKKNQHLYMFSIENLAWKDYPHGIERMRRGPNGGRIMWFPPYDLTFQENVAVEWGNNAFIGRGEKVYTYSNTTRTAQLGFTILIDHPSILDEQKFRNHQGYDEDRDVDGDILRYFAGCNNFVFKEPPQEEEEQKIENKPEQQEEVQKGGTIKFVVFFPNNYSGNMTTPMGSGKTDRINYINTNGATDGDWWGYLLLGHNINIDGTNIGYEMSSVRGISDTDSLIVESATKYPSTDSTEKAIIACKDKCNANFEVCNTENPDKRRRFRYRVDFDLKQNNLHYEKGQDVSVLQNDSYVDSKSYQFNASEEAVNKKTDGMFPNVTCSFGAFMASILNIIQKPEADEIYRQLPSADQNKTEGIIEILNDNVINSIKIIGGATEQDPINSPELARRRRLTVQKTLDRLLTNFKKSEDFHYEDAESEGCEKCKKISEKDKEKYKNTKVFKGLKGSKDINTTKAKYQRCAIVEIAYSKAVVEETGNPTDGSTAANDGNNSGNNEQGTNGGQTTTPTSDKKSKLSNQTQYMTESNKTMTGYEYEYFSRLKEDDPFVFKKIHDKYKYFDPAFHSLSPEGFNARLNFLQQCTRQSHTVSASDVNGTGKTAPTAGNLSFGRMPVCVLRIGDFIYSRFIIESMSIDYSSDGITWDLNPEGAGVQPMFAKVSLGITLLGGSSLAGPINRLQNAQTFDYYANTGVYDPRADRIEINDNGVLYKHLYTPYEGSKNT